MRSTSHAQPTPSAALSDHAADEQPDGVPEQLADPRADQEVAHLHEALLGRRDDDVAQRHEADGGDHDRRQQEADGRPDRWAGARTLRGTLPAVISSTTFSPLRSEIGRRGGSSSSNGLTGGLELDRRVERVLQRVAVGERLLALRAGQELDELLGLVRVARWTSSTPAPETLTKAPGSWLPKK